MTPFPTEDSEYSDNAETIPEPLIGHESTAKNTVVLVGPMTVGKSSIGRALAQGLGWKFFDSDRVIESIYGSVSEIFSTLGEDWFRDVEVQQISELLSRQSPTVLALGGGSVQRQETVAALKSATVVYLHAELEVVRQRVLRSSHRPLLNGEDPLSRWAWIAAEREPSYREVADIIFEVHEGSIEEHAQELQKRLNEYWG